MFDAFITELSTPKNLVAFAKVLLDKGLLAILLVGATLGAAILIERIKTLFVRQQEILKITAPLAIKLLESCDALYEIGIATLMSKAQTYADYELWATNLTSAPVDMKRMPILDIPNGPGARLAILECGGEIVSLVDHLKNHAPSSAIVDLVDSDVFWQQDAVVSEEGSLVRHLYLAYIAKSDVTVASFQYQMSRVFAACKLGRSKEYTAALYRFRQEVIKNLYPGNHKQGKAIEGLLKLIQYNSQAFEDFPTLDIGRARMLGSAKTTTTFEILANNHATMVGLIGQYLRSH